MALTVVFSLLASLAVALFLVPMLASRQWGGPGTGLDLVQTSDFLRPQGLTRARVAMDGEQPLAGRLLRAALAIPYLLWELLWRVALAAATLVAAVLKAAALVLFQLLWWIIKLLEHISGSSRRPPSRKLSNNGRDKAR